MKKFLGVILISCCLMIGTNAQAADTTVNLTGTGIAWSSEWGPDYGSNTGSDASISLTLTAQINGLQIQWVLDVSIAAIGYQETYILDDVNGSLYFDDTNSYAAIWANSCWGDQCPVDEYRPDAVGSNGLDVRVNLTTLEGYVNIWGNNNTSDTGSNFNFIGQVQLAY